MKLKMRAMLAVAVAALVTASAVAMFAPPSQASTVAVDGFEMDGDSATVEDAVGSMWLSAEGTVQWKNMAQPAERITVLLYVQKPPQESTSGDDHPGYDQVAKESYDVNGTSGEQSFTVEGEPIQDATTSWQSRYLDPPEGGEMTESLDVKLHVKVEWTEDGEWHARHDQRYDSMTITVTDEQDDGGNGGDTDNPEITVSATGSTTLEG